MKSYIYIGSMKTISIDFGQHGMAHCIGDTSEYPPMILSLGLGSDTGAINTAERASVVAFRLLRRLPRADLYLLEEQPAINRKTCMLESAFAAAAMASGCKVLHVPTIDVKTEFSLPSGYRQKKKAATLVAAKLMADETQTKLGRGFSAEDFASNDRKHDMADALLIMIWYSRKIHRRLCRELPRHRKKIK